jgi:polyferredoxin
MPEPLYSSLSLTDRYQSGPDAKWGLDTWFSLGAVLCILLGSLLSDFAPYALLSATILFLTGMLSGTLGKEKTTSDPVAYTFVRSIQNRQWPAWVLGFLLTAFYVVLYWFPQYLGFSPEVNTGFMSLFDPASRFLKGSPASQWFAYGYMYTVAVLGMGIKFAWKYRHNRYQLIRTGSVAFFQLGFAFLLPEWMQRLNMPYYDWKNMWPLNYSFFDAWSIQSLGQSGNLGILMIGWGIAMIFIISPILTWYFGKRWYCSWVCGCGALAETAGDPFRHLSDKSQRAWQWERWLIYPILILVTVTTLAVIYSYLPNAGTSGWLNKVQFATGVAVAALVAGIVLIMQRRKWFVAYPSYVFHLALVATSIFTLAGLYAALAQPAEWLPVPAAGLRQAYGFFIGAIFSGVIGVGFYPLLGNRVWCRFGCPMAAILGLQQKWLSRFRITTNGGQCISCGNCSTHCEMGIDVKAYAQEGLDIIRSSCVGCGICATVCPRGVLRLENGPRQNASTGNSGLFLNNEPFA